ncbi:MAG: alkaline phosphatase family protein, partial [Nitrospirales bacterium]|nr:alkaline phosphatase family protein [Nitrospirales bacterium]
DYARTVNIHAKPGYDPCELFLDPAITFPKLKIATVLAKKMLGFRYLMDVIPLNADLVRGSHGRVTDNGNEGPIVMTTEPKLLDSESIEATGVCDLLLSHVFHD